MYDFCSAFEKAFDDRAEDLGGMLFCSNDRAAGVRLDKRFNGVVVPLLLVRLEAIFSSAILAAISREVFSGMENAFVSTSGVLLIVPQVVRGDACGAIKGVMATSVSSSRAFRFAPALLS